jgi:hypothetical protein
MTRTEGQIFDLQKDINNKVCKSDCDKKHTTMESNMKEMVKNSHDLLLEKLKSVKGMSIVQIMGIVAILGTLISILIALLRKTP